MAKAFPGDAKKQYKYDGQCYYGPKPPEREAGTTSSTSEFDSHCENHPEAWQKNRCSLLGLHGTYANERCLDRKNVCFLAFVPTQVASVPTLARFAPDFKAICEGQPTEFQVILSGVPPFSLSWSEGSDDDDVRETDERLKPCDGAAAHKWLFSKSVSVFKVDRYELEKFSDNRGPGVVASAGLQVIPAVEVQLVQDAESGSQSQPVVPGQRVRACRDKNPKLRVPEDYPYILKEMKGLGETGKAGPEVRLEEEGPQSWALSYLSGARGPQCERTIDVEVVSPPKVVDVRPANEEACQGARVRLTAEFAGGGGLKARWKKQDQLVEARNGIVSWEVEDSDTYYIEEVEDSVCGKRGPFRDKVATVTFRPPPTVVKVEAAKEHACQGESVTLRAELAGSGGLKAQWSGQGELVDAQNGIVSWEVTSDGAYYIERVKDSVCGEGGPFRDKVATVTFHDPPTVVKVEAAKEHACQGESVTLTAELKGGKELSALLSGQDESVQAQNGRASWQVDKSGKYYVESLMDSICGETKSVSDKAVTVTFHEPPTVVEVNAERKEACRGESIKLTAKLSGNEGLKARLSGQPYSVEAQNAIASGMLRRVEHTMLSQSAIRSAGRTALSAIRL